MDRNRRQTQTPRKIIHQRNKTTMGEVEITVNFGKGHWCYALLTYDRDFGDTESIRILGPKPRSKKAKNKD